MTTTTTTEEYITNDQLIAMGEGATHSDAFSTRIHAGGNLIIWAPHNGEWWAEDGWGVYINVGGRWRHQVSGSGLPAGPVPEQLAQRIEAATLPLLRARNAYQIEANIKQGAWQ